MSHLIDKIMIYEFRPPSDDKHLQTTFFIISYRFSVADKVKNIEFIPIGE